MRSTDEPGGLPELIRAELGDPTANLRTVHRLDQVVGGLILLARTARAASDLSAQIREGRFEKEYLVLCHRKLPEWGEMSDLLFRDSARRVTCVASQPGPETRPARLRFETIAHIGEHSLALVRLITGRTHQIRAQFSARHFPLVGDRKYGAPEETGGIGLWSCRISFLHPRTGVRMTASRPPRPTGVWQEAAEWLGRIPTQIPDPALGRSSERALPEPEQQKNRKDSSYAEQSD